MSSEFTQQRRRSTIRKDALEEAGPLPPDLLNGGLLPQQKEEDELEYERADSVLAKTPWPSIIVAAVLASCSALQFSLYISGTWPYLLVMDSSTTVFFFGLIISAYSFGQIIGAPLLGFLSNRMENIRIPVSICLALSFTGNLMYICAQLAPAQSRYVIMAARFIAGVGACNISLLKSFVSMSSTMEDRSRALALVTGGVAVGSTIGPAIQLLFTPIGYPGWRIVGRLLFTMYSAPAFAACLINVLGLIALWTLFREDYAGLVVKSDGTEAEKKEAKLPRYDLLAILICHMTIFAQRFTFTNLETLSPVIGQIIFGWTKTEVVFYIGLAHSFVSVLALLTNGVFVSFKMDKILSFRFHCVCALIGLICFHLITFSWPFLPGELNTYSQEEYDAAVANGTEITGCNRDSFSWCESTKPMNVWVYYVTYILFIGVCFPSINITLNTLFSKIIGPRRMAAEQGLLQMTGSVARLLGPLLISNMFTLLGPRASWTLELGVLGCVVLFWAKFYGRMVPLKLPEKKPSAVHSKSSFVPPPLTTFDPPKEKMKEEERAIKLTSV